VYVTGLAGLLCGPLIGRRGTPRDDEVLPRADVLHGRYLRGQLTQMRYLQTEMMMETEEEEE
jgi:hypothetical protein